MTLTTDEEPLIDDQVSPDGEAPREGSLNTTAMRRVLASGFLGNMIETYDFVLYASAAALVFGHYGDRIGRKTALVATMTIMGIASTGIGLLPTYEQIGLWAPAQRAPSCPSSPSAGSP